MVAKRIVPCLDLEDRGVVKGTRFVDLRREGAPVALARRYEREGADEIVALKIDAGRGRPWRLPLLRTLARSLAIPLTVGGGIGSVERAEELLSAGADRVALNTLALARPAVLSEAARRFGRQAVVLAVDARRRPDRRWEVVVAGGTRPTGRNAVRWAAEGARRGAGEVLLTSIDRDGTRHGFDLALLRAARSAINVPVIASGGARGPPSFLSAFRAGADAALAAGIFHERRTTIGEVKGFLAARGVEVRT